jgi:glyoxylase-like metal-dependent hydrolase (beta-lactamase superfamily II)
MTEIIPGIYQLKVPIPNNPLGNTNSYLLRGDDGALIIDPGMNNDESFEALKNELAGAGVTFEEITRIVATHSHGDHYGLSGRVKKLSNAQIIIHQVARDNMQFMAQHRQGRGEEMEQWLSLNGVPKSDPAEFQRGRPQGGGPQRSGSGRPPFPEPTMPDVLLQGGETINVGRFNLKVVFTPGHDPGHICLYESTHKILFSGDHVLPVITPSVGLQTESGVNPLGDFLNSLNTIRQLDVDLVLPAHEQTFTNFRERVDEIITHHQRRDAEIMTAIKDEPKTAYEISQEITWMPSLGGTKFQDLRPWDKRMAVMETLAHLKVMKDTGKVAAFSRNSTIYYNDTNGR